MVVMNNKLNEHKFFKNWSYFCLFPLANLSPSSPRAKCRLIKIESAESWLKNKKKYQKSKATYIDSEGTACVKLERAFTLNDQCWVPVTGLFRPSSIVEPSQKLEIRWSRPLLWFYFWWFL